MPNRKGKKKKKDEGSNVNADDIPAGSRDMVQRLKEIVVNLSEQEIYAMLVECNMNAYTAIDRLLSQERSDAQGTCNQLAGSSTTSSNQLAGSFNSDLANVETNIVPVSSAEAVPSLSVSSSSDLANFDTNIVPISSAEAVPSLSVSSSSDLPNVETKGVPISSSKAVPLRRSRLIPAWDGGISGQRTMADVVKIAIGLSKEGITEAPVKDDCPLHEQPDVTNLSSNSFVESDARRDQLREYASISNHNLRDDGVTNPLSNSFVESDARRDQLREYASISNHNLRNDGVTNPLSNSFIEAAARRDQLREYSASISNQNLRNGGVTNPLSNSFIEAAARRDQFREYSASISNQNLRNGGVTNPLSNSFIEAAARRDQLREYSASISNQNLPVDLLPYYLDIFGHAARRDQLQESAADFTFDDSQWLNPAPERSLQIQSSNTFPNVMHQGAYTRESDPQYSAFPFNQSMPSASSLGRRPSTSMNEALRTANIFVPQRIQQAMNHHYSHPQVPLAHYGNMRNSPYLPPNQNNSYNMPPPSIFQQHGGSNSNTYYRHQPLALMLPEYRNSHLPQSAYDVGTSSDNAANSRFGYEDVLSSQFNRSNRLPSIQHQNVNSNVWRVQGEDTWSLAPRHRNQQTPSFRQIQQQQQEDQEQEQELCLLML